MLELREFKSDEHDARTQRIFDMGHHIEDVILSKLASPMDIMTTKLGGGQFSYSEEELDHILKCHVDGVDVAYQYLVEVKSMNESSFNSFKSHGVLVSHPQYYSQVQACMGMADIDWCLVIAMNKNNQEIHFEWVPFDEMAYRLIVYRLKTILMSDAPAQRISDNPKHYVCKMCPKKTACHTPEEAVDVGLEKCSHCKHSRPEKQGLWYCDLHNKQCLNTCDDFSYFRPSKSGRK